MKQYYLITLLLLSICTSQAQNLFTNPGFESGNTGWNSQVNAGTATVDFTSTMAHTGTYACNINVTVAASQNYEIQLNTPVDWTAQPDTKYKLSFYAKTDNAVSIHVAAQTGPPDYAYLTGSDFSLDATWKLIEFNYTSSSSLVSGAGALRFNIFTGTAVANYYFDDFTLEVIPDVVLPAPNPPTTGAYYTDVYRNMFEEMGKDVSAINNKVNTAFQQLFHGNASTEAVYYEVAPDMAYIKDINSDDIRSEGMSYGMMIAVQLNKKDEFDRLWKFAKTYMQHQTGPRQGYFAWHVDPTTYAQLDANSASDGEEYFAMSLFFAAHRWGNGAGMFNYEAEANQLLDDMLNLETRNGGVVSNLTNMFNKTRKQVVFVPEGDNALFTDPSYHLPAFYKLWAEWAEQDNQFWSDAADTSKVFLLRAMHPTTGLPTEYMTFDGAPKATTFNSNSDIFAYDSWRVIGNIAMDCHWFGNEGWQSQQVNKLLQFFYDEGAGYKALYNQDGTLPASTSTASGIVSMNGAGTLASSQDIAWGFLGALYDQVIPSGTYRYYDGMLYMMSLLHASGNYRIWKPGAATAIKKNRADADLVNIYPNPAQANANTLFVESDTMNNGVILVNDAFGRTVTTSELKSGRARISLSGLSKGIYYVQITDGDKSIVKKIFMD